MAMPSTCWYSVPGKCWYSVPGKWTNELMSEKAMVPALHKLHAVAEISVLSSTRACVSEGDKRSPQCSRVESTGVNVPLASSRHERVPGFMPFPSHPCFSPSLCPQLQNLIQLLHPFTPKYSHYGVHSTHPKSIFIISSFLMFFPCWISKLMLKTLLPKQWDPGINIPEAQ